MTEPATASRVVGILGGMGPAATVDFYDRLVRATPAETDQDHLRVAIWADPTIPNRHAALLGDGEDPTPWLERGLRHLMACGAEIIVAPCNTAHAFLPAVIADADVEFLSIIDTTVLAVEANGDAQRVGLLAADGAVASQLYQSALDAAGHTALLPSQAAQEGLMATIYAVKSDRVGDEAVAHLSLAVRELEAAGATTLVVGCTELSILIARVATGMAVVDASDALAERAVQRACTPDRAPAS